MMDEFDKGLIVTMKIGDGPEMQYKAGNEFAYLKPEYIVFLINKGYARFVDGAFRLVDLPPHIAEKVWQ